MNLRNLTVAYKVANHFFGRYRELNAEQKRNVYEAVRVLANPEASGSDDTRYSAARREAGPLTRAAHDRLDRQRALFDATQLDKQARQLAEKQAKQVEKVKKAQKKKKSTSGIGAGVGILSLLAAIAGAVWYFLFREDTTGTPASRSATARPAHSTTKTATTSTATGSQTGSGKIGTGKIGTGDRIVDGGDHGPLSEEPAQRDEKLLNSIDEQLSTLDTLDDDQRNVTKPNGN